MSTQNNNTHNSHHLPEPPVWLKLLIALGVATLAYQLLGTQGGIACLLAGMGHTLTPLLEALWHAGVRWLQQHKQKPLTSIQIRALMLCGVIMAVGVGVPAGHWLTHAPPIPQ